MPVRSVGRSRWRRLWAWHVGALLLVFASGCGPGGVQELFVDPDANEILRRHFNLVNSKSVVRPTDRVRVEGSMRIDNYVGNFSLTENGERHYSLNFSGKADPSAGTSSAGGPTGATLVMAGGWNGRVEWAKINGMLMKQEACTERADNGVGLLNFTEKELSLNPFVTLLGRSTVQNRDVFIIEHRPASGTVSTINFDVKTYEILSARIARPAGSGVQARTVDFEFLDWKVVDGVFGPSRITGKSDGKDLGMVVTGIDYDPTFDDSIFSP